MHYTEKWAHLPFPISDKEAWAAEPKYRWMFNKLLLCEEQGIEAAPLGIPCPLDMPFVKPVYNLEGMGAGSYQAESNDLEYEPGKMWMKSLHGMHISTDMWLMNGKVIWYYSMLAQYCGKNPVRWRTYNPRPIVASQWAEKYFKDYTGPVNVEKLGPYVIECVPRLSPQFIDFYPHSSGTSYVYWNKFHFNNRLISGKVYFPPDDDLTDERFAIVNAVVGE